jgi:SRSO17 transposase
MTTQDEGGACFETLAQERYPCIEGYADVFTSRTPSAVEQARQDVSGLFQAEKSTIEKLRATVKGSAHQHWNHFIRQSPGEAATLLARIGQDPEQELHTVAPQTGPTGGDLVAESGWRKQDLESVGVARPYWGSLGKGDHGQVAGFGRLVCGTARSLINTRLFLPEGGTDNAVRCDPAGIPHEARSFKTKPMLA